MGIEEILLWVKENAGSTEPSIHRYCLEQIAEGLRRKEYPQVEFALQNHYRNCKLCQERINKAEILSLIYEAGLLPKPAKL